MLSLLPCRELMHHYLTALDHLGARAEVVQIWRNYIPEQAVKHPFLMHGILALTALYLAHLRPYSAFKYFQKYDKHQGIALQKFRSILSSPIDTGQADALLALASTLSVSSMAKTCAQSQSSSMTMDAIAELFILTKGIRTVNHLAHVHSKHGPMAEMLRDQPGYPPNGADVQLPLRVSSCFEAVQRMLLACALEQEALEDCQTALKVLESIYKNIAHISKQGGIETGDVSRWQVRVSMGYIRLVQARSPPALVILAYYAAAMTAVRTAWYAQGWAEFALRGISQALEGNMQQWIQWPMQQVTERMSELGVQSSCVQPPLGQSADDGSSFDRGEPPSVSL